MKSQEFDNPPHLKLNHDTLKIFVMYIKVTGLVRLEYRPTNAFVQILEQPINEVGTDIQIEALGMDDGFLVMIESYGIYPMSIPNGGSENFTTAMLTAENSAPLLYTSEGTHVFDESKIWIGSSYMIDMEEREGMMLIRSKNCQKAEAKIS